MPIFENLIEKLEDLNIDEATTPESSQNICPLASESVQEVDERLSTESQRFALALKRRMLKTQLCQYFRSGNCRYGDNCAYAHGQDDLREKPSDKDIPEEFKLSNGTRPKIYKVCFRYLDGFCPFGDECHYIHEKSMQLEEEKKKEDRKKALERQNATKQLQTFRKDDNVAPSPAEFLQYKKTQTQSFHTISRDSKHAYDMPVPISYAPEYENPHLAYEYEARRAAYYRMRMKMQEKENYRRYYANDYAPFEPRDSLDEENLKALYQAYKLKKRQEQHNMSYQM